MKKYFYSFLFLSIAIGTSPAFSAENDLTTSAKTNFTVKPFSPAFVKNLGQFDQYASGDNETFYGSRMGNAIVLFHGNSVEFLENIAVNHEEKNELYDKDRKTEREFKTCRQSLTFVNANANAKLITSESVSQYYTYPDPRVKNGTITANAWNELALKNIYNGIDVSFSYAEEGGLKYSFTVQPGADPSLIQLKWDGVDNISIDKTGDLSIPTENGIITDKAPHTFYAGDEKSVIHSSFSLKGKKVSFTLADYDHAKTVVIDPWVINPNFLNFNHAYDIQHNQSGEIYVYGGATPYQLQKYTSAGAPLWTYTTNGQGYYGDFTLDAAGNAYCIYGPWTNECVKVDPAGAAVWTSVNPNSAGSIETYRIFPNPITGLLDVIGMQLLTGNNPMAESIDPSNGNYSPYSLHPACSTAEARGLAVDINGDLFVLVFATINLTIDNLLWKMDANFNTTGSVQTNYMLSETQMSNTDSWYSGYNGVTVDANAVYTYDGLKVKKWDKNTLVALDSVLIPGGVAYVTAGLCTDSCGNVFVGGPNSILEFDSSLTLVTSVATTGQVYDVNNGNGNGEILACGNAFAGSFTFPVCSTVPVAIFTAPNHICPGTCTNFVNHSTGNGLTFQWFFPGATPSVSTDVSPVNICYNTPGTYSVTLIATNANGIDTLTLNNFVTVYPYPPPQGILQSGDTLFANQGAISYQWYYGGTLIPGATNYYYVAPQSGDYNVVATDVNGCEVEAVIYDVTAEVTQAGSTLDMEIFPNPADGKLEIRIPEITGRNSEKTSMVIYNPLGEIVLDIPSAASRPRSAGITVQSGGSYVLDVSSLPSGMYYLQVDDGSNSFRAKFTRR